MQKLIKLAVTVELWFSCYTIPLPSRGCKTYTFLSFLDFVGYRNNLIYIFLRDPTE